MFEDLALPADCYLVTPVFLRPQAAVCSTYEPAEISRLEFPGGATLFMMGRAFQDIPAVFPIVTGFFCQQEEKLAFHVSGNVSPTLLIAADSLQ